MNISTATYKAAFFTALSLSKHSSAFTAVTCWQCCIIFSGKNLFHNFLNINAFWITAIRVFEMECHLRPWLHPAYLMVQCDHLVTFSDLNSLGKAGPRREPLPRGKDLSFPEENELWIGASLSYSLDFLLRGPARHGGSFNVSLGSQGGFLGGSAWEPACQCRRLRCDSCVGKIPWRRK